jgi:hypothetical protein
MNFLTLRDMISRLYREQVATLITTRKGELALLLTNAVTNALLQAEELDSGPPLAERTGRLAHHG